MTIALYPELTRDDVFMIATKRLWLRWPRLADAEAVAAFSGHPDVASKTGSWPVGCDTAFARERIAKTRAANEAGTSLGLIIAPNTQWSRAIGFIGIGSQVTETGEPYGYLGYHLSPDFWGRGYATEAVGGLLRMTRYLTRVPLVRASVMPHNIASRRVLEANGFVQSGRGQLASAFRGTFDVDHFEVSLRDKADMPTVGRCASGPSPLEISVAAH